jgi:hypothetical protein
MKILPQSQRLHLTTIVCAVLLPLSSAFSAPSVEDKGNFGPPQVTFSEVPSFTPLNGLTINGLTFSENVPISFTAPAGFGPGNTNNISGAMALSGLGSIPAGYVLSVSLANQALSFGFGFALQGLTTSVANAVTLTLFSGATNLGSLSFAGNADPNFTGGFAGIGNNVFFDRVQITFNQNATGFAVDNFVARDRVPENGGTLLMLLAGAAPLGVLARLRRRAV